jgi:hypothetical protein
MVIDKTICSKFIIRSIYVDECPVLAVEMLSKEVEYKEGVELPPDQVINLYSQCRWSSAEKPDALLFALSNSETLISAWYQNILIGLGNAISDKALTVYYPHLLVLPKYQNR